MRMENTTEKPLTIQEVARMGGLKGGKSRSKKKLRASQANLAHARDVLAGQREAAKKDEST